jgi:hypothetical protein
MQREASVRILQDRLGSSRLIWFGANGQDARALLALEQFTHCFSLFGPLDAVTIEEKSLERLTRKRQVTLKLEAMLHGDGLSFLEAIKDACDQPSYLVSYSYLPFASVLRASSPNVTIMGLTRDQNRLLNAKALVEEALAKLGTIKMTPWWTAEPGPNRLEELRTAVHEGPIVLRLRQGIIGSGRAHELVQDEDALGKSILLQRDVPLSVAPYLIEHLPVSIHGCVFRDGGVTLHTPSVQLIGLANCTRFPFGFCGNDFGRAKQLSPVAVRHLEDTTRAVGRWLHTLGYRGIFGIDAMAHEEEVLFMEINPRFLGSSRLSAKLDAENGLSDIFLDHLMAWLGLDSYEQPPLDELLSIQRERAHLLCYNTDQATRHSPGPTALQMDGSSIFLEPDRGIEVEPDALMFNLEFASLITSTGKDLLPAATAAMDRVMETWVVDREEQSRSASTSS